MHYLAQVNVSRLLAPLDSAQLADFVANLEPINALADAAPGFVWRLKSDTGNATSIQVYADPMIIVNMSVWESLDALREFAFGPAHAEIMRRRKEWFGPFGSSSTALWWLPAGQIPTPDEARQRLETLDQRGPTPDAFTFRQLFPAPALTGFPY
jgi:Domain of unknown function (DUF3291)